MRLLALALLVACGPRATTIVAPGAPRTEERPVEHCIERPSEGDPNKARRDEVLAELGRVEGELDAIDDELEAAARQNGISLVDAKLAVTMRRAALDAVTTNGAAPAGSPRLLAHAVHDVQLARVEKSQLAGDYGARHPLMVRADARIALFEARVRNQLATERAFLTQWGDALAALPAKATPDAVYKAHAAALLQSLRSTPPPSDSPAAVRVAVERVAELDFTRAMLERDVGPKHPDLMAARARLDAAQADLAAAISAADTELAARIAAPPRAPDAKAIARRAELADQARELRREYERLLAR